MPADGRSLRREAMPYRAPLDWLNFLLADVRGGLGPYVSVFLLTEGHWDQATIGAVLTVSGIIGIALHTPVGALIDATHAKRGLIISGACALSACALAIAWAPTLPIVLVADCPGCPRGRFRADRCRDHAWPRRPGAPGGEACPQRRLRPRRQSLHRRRCCSGRHRILIADRLLSRPLFCGPNHDCHSRHPGPRHRS